MDGTDRPTVTFGPSVAETVLTEGFGWSVDEDGTITDGNSPVEATDGEAVTLDELGGIVERDGEPAPLRDDFVSIVEEVKRRSQDTGAGKSGDP